MNEQNLRTPTTSEAREIGRKGGLTRAANARRRKEHQEKWRALLEMVDDYGLSTLDKLDRALANKASEGDVNAYEKIMEYSGLSVRLNLKEEELRIKSEELKLKKAQAEIAEHSSYTSDDPCLAVLEQIRGAQRDAADNQ